MKLSDFLDVADDDDMVEVYADDGVTRPCEVKLVDAFQVSDWVGGTLDVRDELEVYLNREVTGVATAMLDGRGRDGAVAMRVYVEQKEGDGDKPGGHGRVKTSKSPSKDPPRKVVGIRVHEHSVPELVIYEVPEGHGTPANLVVLPGVEAPDTDELGGDDDAIGFELAGRIVSQCVKAEEAKSRSHAAMCEHLSHAYFVLCDLVTLVGASATETVSEESVEALIRAAIDRVKWAGSAMGFDLEEGK